jgi:hypothetical protein
MLFWADDGTLAAVAQTVHVSPRGDQMQRNPYALRWAFERCGDYRETGSQRIKRNVSIATREAQRLYRHARQSDELHVAPRTQDFRQRVLRAGDTWPFPV